MSPPGREGGPAPTGPRSTSRSLTKQTRSKDTTACEICEAIARSAAIARTIETLEAIVEGVAISLLAGAWLMQPTADDLILMAQLIYGAIDDLELVA